MTPDDAVLTEGCCFGNYDPNYKECSEDCALNRSCKEKTAQRKDERAAGAQVEETDQTQEQQEKPPKKKRKKKAQKAEPDQSPPKRAIKKARKAEAPSETNEEDVQSDADDQEPGSEVSDHVDDPVETFDGSGSLVEALREVYEVTGQQDGANSSQYIFESEDVEVRVMVSNSSGRVKVRVGSAEPFVDGPLGNSQDVERVVEKVATLVAPSE